MKKLKVKETYYLVVHEHDPDDPTEYGVEADIIGLWKSKTVADRYASQYDDAVVYSLSVNSRNIGKAIRIVSWHE